MARNDSTDPIQNGSVKLFAGFAPPTSNTTYTPNQFFDVCLPHYSRGVVRLVAYMIRQTLGWCDVHGNPQHETISVSYTELEKHAGVSHSMIHQALAEAEKGGFLRRVRIGQASSRSIAGVSAAYELAWDEGGQYVKDPKQFKGFFAGEGNRTYIPNQFFDRLVPGESLAMIQVVGAIIRFSIGFVNKYGHRRQRVALSYRDIQRYAHIASPRILSKAIRKAMTTNYIERVEEGYFDPDAGRLSRAAHYAVKWAQAGGEPAATLKSEAGKIDVQNHSEKFSGTAPKSEAENHSEKFSGIQIKQKNNTLKQQAPSALTAVAVAFEKLKAQGFDARAAQAIADRFSAARIERQIGWIDRRAIRRNRLGMLRASIEQDWLQPGIPRLGEPAGRVLRRLNSDAGADRQSGQSFVEVLGRLRERLIEPTEQKNNPFTS
jgi:hypothetical protein